MKSDGQSNSLLGVTRSKAKMYEYSVPSIHHITIAKDPAALLRLTIGMLGDYAAASNAKELDQNKIDELRKTLLFSAQFFDAYINSKLNSELDAYLLLVGSASYYLCDFPGSSSVLSQKIGSNIDVGCEGLENLLLSLLKNDYESLILIKSSKYSKSIDFIYTSLVHFLKTGENADKILDETNALRMFSYEEANDRELLITDIICTVIKKRIRNSTWKALPRYTNIEEINWNPIIQKPSFIKEFWPAQILLGEKGVLRGNSAIVQMPTSAGKTKSIEIIIRSAFLSGQAQMAIIVAPFKALCSEIKFTMQHSFDGEAIDIDAPSDTFQTDFTNLEELSIEMRNLILIVTPEKLMYILRHAPELADRIGILIFDEGHQFDAGLRGVTYELLLSSLKMMIKRKIQTVLISAVISNSEAIGKWLNGEEGELVSGINLSPTYRTVAFASWQDQQLGRLQFVQPLDIDISEYFVPRVIEQTQLEKKNKERKVRIFPDKSNGQMIALYLGIKLVHNGAVAIFCGTKQSVIGLCESFVELYDRKYPFDSPSCYSNKGEVERLRFLHEKHFGVNYTTTKSAALGVFAHSANTPNGVRIAIEYAMQKGKIKFVICTSTLAQGVNLPIKYLIVTSVYQAGQRIKTRDFHNLIGRAGRAGMHTEGSILFADPEVYDKKLFSRENWRWKEVKTLLDPANSEPCASTLASLFEPLYSDDGTDKINIKALEFVEAYVANKQESERLPSSLSERFASEKFSKQQLARQIQTKIKIIAAIESYLMSYWEEAKVDEEDASNLARGTLAFYLSNNETKDDLVKIFSLLVKNVTSAFEEPTKRKAYGKTLFGVKDILEIEKWVEANIEHLKGESDGENLLEKIWPLISTKISNDGFKKISPNSALLSLALGWIRGLPYFQLYDLLVSSKVVLVAGKQQRQVKQDTVVDICENALSYDATLIVAAIVEVLNVQKLDGKEALIELLNELQKRLKYGLDSKLSISFFEFGFSDRVIARELVRAFDNFGLKRWELIMDLKRMQEEVSKILVPYPEYYTSVLNSVATAK